MASRRMKMSPVWGAVAFALIFILLVACAYSAPPGPLSRFYPLFLVDIAALVLFTVWWLREGDTSQFSPEEKKAGNRFGMIMSVMIVVLPLLGYFHKQLGL
jgi:hypothetical protein